MEYFDKIVALLVVLFILFFPLVKRILVARQKKREGPPEVRREVESREEQFRPFVKQIAPKPEKLKAHAIPSRTVGRDFKFQSKLGDFQRKKTRVESRHVGTRVKPKFKETVVSDALAPRELVRRKRLSSMDKLLTAPPSLKKMVILHEIFQGPKSLQ
ncbi:MAG: hypothetical protein KR126chlam2_01241 [Chlamydiae bacterium]|nr:hypothetical protein [Chlamydiota bacterium]